MYTSGAAFVCQSVRAIAGTYLLARTSFSFPVFTL
jgi:hypothetical protein